MKKRVKKPFRIMIAVLFILLLTSSMIGNLYFVFFSTNSYLQDEEEIYVMESGILKNNLEFMEGEDLTIAYELQHEEYTELITRYHIEEIAGTGSEFQKASRLMHEFAPRLEHASDYDNHVDMNALSLLEYSLDNKSHGINCRNKAQILNEMCLALGIYARKVWICPYSVYDQDCHVVNEVWDTNLNKWIMLDITNDQYWVDKDKMPLSVLEVRKKGALQEFCTPVSNGDSMNNLPQLKRKHIGDFLYIMKNMVYIEYCSINTVGETDIYLLLPKNLPMNYENIISENACMADPKKE